MSRLERSILVAVVVAGVLVLAGGVWAFANRDRITVWLTGDEVVAAQRVAMTADLPLGLEDDPTRSACHSWTALRCAWSDAGPQEAAQLMAGVLTGAGLGTGELACSELSDVPDVPDGVRAADAVCAARFTAAGESLWVVATDRTPGGHVPLGRTATWLVWDESSLSWPMMERLQGEWPWAITETYPAPTAGEVTEVLPERFRPLLEGPCGTETAAECFHWEGPVDLADLGDDPVQALVLELTDAGFFVDAASLGDGSGEKVRAHRFLHESAPGGLSVSVWVWDGVLTGQVFTF